VVDVGFIGMPNAGKSTLLNSFTNARSAVGAYPFTTLEPHLGDLFGYVLADIPGLIEGAADGKGLGHTFLRHVTRTKMLLHLVSLEHDDPIAAYYIIQKELASYHKSLIAKEEWIIFTKKDLVSQEKLASIQHFIDNIEKRVFVISAESGDGMKTLQDSLVLRLREQ
jgi:GTP-binding protein